MEPVHTADGPDPGPSQRGGEIAAGLSVPGGASSGERAAAGGETGGESRVVDSVESLLRAAADVVGGNCAAIGIGGGDSAPTRPPNNRKPGGTAPSTRLRLNFNCEI